MDLAVISKLPFHDIRPGTPLRIEVKNDIYFGPVNQQNYGTILARVGLGIEISRRLDGYWFVNESLRLIRVPFSGVPPYGPHLSISVDLAEMSLEQVCGLHALLTRFFEPDLEKVLL